MTLLAAYVRALREEPKVRAYLLATVVDDIGVAVSGWAGVLLMTNLFQDQRARASVMLPSLVCFLVGALVAGPLADWERAPERIGAYRWKLVVWGRVVETIGLASVVVSTARGLTLSNVLPYLLISALMKTALRPTREAFFVDLMRCEQVRVDGDGQPMRDERGRPLKAKTHLLTFEALIQALKSGAAFAGLLLGGAIVRAVRSRYEVLFAIDIATTLVFITLVATTCHPQLSRLQVRLRDLLSVRPAAHGAVAVVRSGLRHFLSSAREVAGYLRLPQVRPLLWILFGDWLVEVIDEFYSGDMIVKHVLHGSDDALRYASIVWSAASLAALALVPGLSRRVGGLGPLFLATMLLDGATMVVAGQVGLAFSARALVPFVAALAADRALTATSGTLSALATASASGAGIRGRIFAVVPVFTILGDMLAEALSTPISERYGIPAMVRGLGVAQIALMLIVAVVGGAAFWRYGLRSQPAAEAGGLRP